MENISPEELEKMVEKAKKELQAKLDQMTPEECAQAERKAQKLIEEDQAAREKLLATAAEIAGTPSSPKAPKFCGHCGAPVNGGRFCEYCGLPYENR